MVPLGVTSLQERGVAALGNGWLQEEGVAALGDDWLQEEGLAALDKSATVISSSWANSAALDSKRASDNTPLHSRTLYKVTKDGFIGL